MVGSCGTLSKVPLLKFLIEKVHEQGGLLQISTKDLGLLKELNKCSNTCSRFVGGRGDGELNLRETASAKLSHAVSPSPPLRPYESTFNVEGSRTGIDPAYLSKKSKLSNIDQKLGTKPMTLAHKFVVDASVYLEHVNLNFWRIWKRSVSSLIKFKNAQENECFWLERLNHKDWLAPNEFLQVFGNLRDPELIMVAFEKASARVDYKPSEALYSLLIDRLACGKKFDSIGELLDKAKHEKCRLSNDFFYRAIKIYGNVANHPEEAINILFRMPEFHCWPNVKTFNYMLNMLVCRKQFEVIHEIFLSATPLGVSLDTCSFNILIKGLCELGKFEAGFSILKEIPKHGLRPNATTYSTLMHSFCNHGRVDEAFEVYELMEREGCCPDTVTFNILISGLCKKGKADEGMGLLKTMTLKGCCPNSDTYQALLYGLLHAKRFVEAKDFICMGRSEGIRPSFLSYKMAIEGLCSEKLLNDVGTILKLMVDQGFVPRMGTWKKIIECMFS
ncbi:Pentatricopeptide repeat-containing protein [Apostasia shenzhenica]|uniref:Pentatricopeptide repeat-containing protein n=1 Tax=Apostasia shenzhenica TaxID=1088818 RepID=A0A2I0AC17_9ASPA|nr:Pentatricopeptide repeat-containing protein [Apostasia shenzhenica]